MIAPAKVRHGAVRLQGSASLPTPETKVRVACADAGDAKAAAAATTAANKAIRLLRFVIALSPFFGVGPGQPTVNRGSWTGNRADGVVDPSVRPIAQNSPCDGCRDSCHWPKAGDAGKAERSCATSCSRP